MKTDKNQALDQFNGRLKKEALLKAVLSALAVGFASVLVTALICWFTAFDGYWIFAITLIVPVAVALPLFYFFAFYPSDKYIAKRLDRLGLDERVQTMIEFGNQDSYIMQRQREDALAALGKVNSRLIKFAVSAAIISLAAVGVIAGTTMTSVYALAEAGFIPTGKELVAQMNEDKTTYELVYSVKEDAGMLYSASYPEGATTITLTVKKGGDGEIVRFKPAKGFVFTRWADGVTTTLRRDTNVQGKIVATIGYGDLEGEYGDNKAEDERLPKLIKERDDDDPNDGPTMPAPPKKDPEEGEENKQNAVSQKDQFANDGKTDYGGAPYDSALQDSMAELTQPGGADDASKEIASNYFEAIKRG